jgi:hypothetical protein
MYVGNEDVKKCSHVVSFEVQMFAKKMLMQFI